MHNSRLVPYLFLSVILSSVYVYYVAPELLDPRFKWENLGAIEEGIDPISSDQLIIRSANFSSESPKIATYHHTDSLLDVFQHQLDSLDKLDSLFHQMSFQYNSYESLHSPTLGIGINLNNWNREKFMDERLRAHSFYNDERNDSQILDSIWNLYMGQFGVRKRMEESLGNIVSNDQVIDPLVVTFPTKRNNLKKDGLNIKKAMPTQKLMTAETSSKDEAKINQNRPVLKQAESKSLEMRFTLDRKNRITHLTGNNVIDNPKIYDIKHLSRLEIELYRQELKKFIGLKEEEFIREDRIIFNDEKIDSIVTKNPHSQVISSSERKDTENTPDSISGKKSQIQFITLLPVKLMENTLPELLEIGDEK